MRFLTIILLFWTTAGVAQDKLPEITLAKLDGRTTKTSEITNTGKITIISFWATWCKPCLEELSNISDVFDEWKEQVDFQFIAISIDDSRSNSRVKSLVIGKNWPFEFYIDSNQELKRALNVSEIPYTIILNNNGQIVHRHISYLPGSETILLEEIKNLSTK